MSDPSPALSADPDHPVWQALSSYKIGPDDVPLGFAQRLARENGWPELFAHRVIGEYKRFCFLAVTAGQDMTPSDEVDQAWHLHLTYSRDYWERFCPQVLGMPLHHGPTAGNPADRDRYVEQYAQTLKAYESVFGPAPRDIWPDARRRFLEDPKARRVHPRDGIVVRRRTAGLLLALSAIVLVMWFLWWRF